jgi:hypothetical protein
MNATLGFNQVEHLTLGISLDIKKELIETYPDLNKYELKVFIDQVVNVKLKAVLVTLTEAAYEDIVKVVRDKLNLNDLFDNRQKYLN